VLRADVTPLDELRATLQAAAAAPRGPFVVAAYHRASLGQTGAGHFSPLAGYHPARDLALVLDVARFKYPPHWVALADLHRAMQELDPQSGRARGLLVLERSSLPLALLFRLQLETGPGSMRGLAFETLPSLLDLAEGATQLRGALDAKARTALAHWGETLAATLAALPAEHATLVDALLCELRATPLFALARAAHADAPEPLLSELLTVLLLALPDSAFSASLEPAPARVQLRNTGQGALAREILALREQLVMLRSWTGAA
jgi:glutathione gamma-glutamylcysteinyltransferase